MQNFKNYGGSLALMATLIIGRVCSFLGGFVVFVFVFFCFCSLYFWFDFCLFRQPDCADFMLGPVFHTAEGRGGGKKRFPLYDFATEGVGEGTLFALSLGKLSSQLRVICVPRCQ